VTTGFRSHVGVLFKRAIIVNYLRQPSVAEGLTAIRGGPPLAGYLWRHRVDGRRREGYSPSVHR
jgi:hypothetical protein